MARPLRVEYEGALYHVTSRGNARQDIYLDDKDRDSFLEVLAVVVDRFNWICHAYCLMSNHYHLLVETPDANLSQGMRYLNSVYTQRFNRRHHRVGHVLQGRFKSILVERESHLLELARYVVLNPVRARMVRSVRHWPWSSYRATAGQEQALPLLTTDWILAQFGDDPKRATANYRKFVRKRRGVGVWDQLRGGILLGSEDFVGDLAPQLHDATLQTEILRRERFVARPSLEDIFARCSTKEARNAGIYEATRIHGYKLSELEAYLGLHYSTISRIASRVDAEMRSKSRICSPCSVEEDM